MRVFQGKIKGVTELTLPFCYRQRRIAEAGFKRYRFLLTGNGFTRVDPRITKREIRIRPLIKRGMKSKCLAKRAYIPLIDLAIPNRAVYTFNVCYILGILVRRTSRQEPAYQ